MPLLVRTGRRRLTIPAPADALDITRTPHLHALDWPARGATPGAIAQYEEQALAVLRTHYREHRDWWAERLQRPSVTLLCNIHPRPAWGEGQRCVRVLLAEVLVKLGAVYPGEVEGPPG